MKFNPVILVALFSIGMMMSENSNSSNLNNAECLEPGAPLKSKTEILFNGKDFSNWKLVTKDTNFVFEDVWQISNEGDLICTGKGVSYIHTKKEDYRNYILTLDWRWITPGNSGVLIHALPIADKGIWSNSVEVQLAHKSAGDLYVYGINSFKVAGEEKRNPWNGYVNYTDDSEKPVGEWNHLEVRCENKEIIVYVNGILVNHAVECGQQSGAIGLQSEKREIHFRKIELNPID